MRRAPMLLGAALLLWGWRTDLLAFAVPMAAAVEGARWVRWRWALSDREFNRVADLCSILFLGVILYQVDAYSYHAIFPILRWMPFVVFLLVVSQLYSTRDRIRLSALFLSIRRALAKRHITQPGEVDIAYPYFVICLLAASAGPVRAQWFYFALSGLVAWALWRHRPARFVRAAWITAMVAAIAIGYAGEKGIIKARRSLEPIVWQWFNERMWRRQDPYRAQTAIGEIGKLKLSDRIVLRVRPLDRQAVPGLLREASYQTFSKHVWLAGNAAFEEVEPDAVGTGWSLFPPPPPPAAAGGRVRVSGYLNRGRGVLAVPVGTYRVDGLNVEQVQRNPLGAIRANTGPDLIEYTARYAPERSFDALPEPADRAIPATYRPLFAEVAGELGLAGLSPAAAVRRVERYFRDNFRYSLVLRRARASAFAQPLTDFLKRTRTGHCEYFATSTVLLLRAAGIPARYATGFAVKEYSRLERSYIVRRRHAHSWALVYLDGRWRNVDTTPAVWAPMEADSAPWWEPGYDLLSWLRYRYDAWRWGESDGESGFNVLFVVVPLVLLLGWRLYSGRRVVVARRRGAPERTPSERPGGGSDFYRIEAYLARNGLERSRGETLNDWIRRLRAAGRLPGADLVADAILPIHYRYRFDPGGIDGAERARLERLVGGWMERFAG